MDPGAGTRRRPEIRLLESRVIDQIAAGDAALLARLGRADAKPDKAPFVNAVQAFHLTNAIARASRVMGECASLAAAPAVAAE